jgi:hypothetical protein
MLPVLNYKQVLRNIVFPVYVISSEETSYEDGLLFIGGKIVDDRNQSGDTIGKRRLVSPHPLGKLGKICFTFIEMLDSKSTKFIDTCGRAFEYKKTKMLPVVSYRINKKISRETFTQLFLKGVNCVYTVPRYPTSEEWAQIFVYDNLPWKLYSLSDNKVETFRRKI